MLNVRPGRPRYDGIDFLRSADRKTRLFVALRSKSKSKRGLANLLKHAEGGFSPSSSLGFTESFETPEAVKVGM
jgi:hypothetical protein